MVSLKLLLVSLVLWGMVGCQGKLWCYKTSKHITRTLVLPEMRCRPIKRRPGPVSLDLPSVKPAPLSKLRDDKTTAKEMIKMYPGLFLTKTKAKEMQKRLKPKVITERPVFPGRGTLVVKKSKLGSSDGDIHCPTFRELIEAPEKLNDLQKTPRSLVHFPSEGVFQYIHRGKCGNSDGTKTCNGGGCYQEKAVVYLMVWTENTDWPTSFEAFEIDSYCSCKGIQ